MKNLSHSETLFVSGGFRRNNISFNGRGFDFGRNFSVTINELPKMNNMPNAHKNFGGMLNFKFRF